MKPAVSRDPVSVGGDTFLGEGKLKGLDVFDGEPVGSAAWDISKFGHCCCIL